MATRHRKSTLVRRPAFLPLTDLQVEAYNLHVDLQHRTSWCQYRTGPRHGQQMARTMDANSPWSGQQLARTVDANSPWSGKSEA